MEDHEWECLPETQPIEDDQKDFRSQVREPSQPSCWGRLYPLSRSLEKYDLIETQVTFGTENCTFLLPKVLLHKRYSVCICRKHFEIKRTTLNTKGHRRTVVKLLNHSESGLYVRRSAGGGSSIRLLPGRSANNEPFKILQNNDIISLPTCRKGDLFHAFVYVDCFASQLDHVAPIVHRKYQVSYRLGHGTFGEVYLVFDKGTGEPYAMKAIVQNTLTDPRHDQNRAKLINEVEILKSLQHTHIIECVDVLDFRNDTFLFLEYMAGGDLSERIKQDGCLSEELSKLFFYQICVGVQYLHDHHIIHRDVKPANVLMASNSKETIVKLTDFGLSKVLSSTIHMKTACGTKMYAAPELLSGKENRRYTSKVDVWSLGVLLYVCLSGLEPFVATPHLMEDHIRRGLYVMDPQQWGRISAVSKNFIDSMLLTNPDLRIGIDAVVQHGWFKDEKMHSKLRILYEFHGSQSDLRLERLSVSPPLKKCKAAR